ncbi:MAG: hypothetical protein WB444_15690 [Gallionella sp.]
MKLRRFLDPNEALRRLETRLGRSYARMRLGIEREHEAQAFGQGLTFLHIENMPVMAILIVSGVLRPLGVPQRL